MKLNRTLAYTVMIGVIAALLSSCTMLLYYGQSISGHLRIVQKKRSIRQILGDPGIDKQRRTEFNRILDIREFASNELQLPDNESYRTYADLGREFVVWNVVATPEFSLEPVKWCFLVAGCIPYRGYFVEADAIKFADKLKAGGYDVFIGGVTAYSTLGWFADPVLNTMTRRGTVQLARIMFHELAHQKIYILDDTDYNEAFADTVARIGVRRWLQSTNQIEALHQFEQELATEERFTGLLLDYKDKLDQLYHSNLSATEKRTRKVRIFNAMLTAFEDMHSDSENFDDYAIWFENGPNNAKLATIITYRDLVPDFLALYATVNHNLEQFYNRAALLGKCGESTRRQLLKSGLARQACVED